MPTVTYFTHKSNSKLVPIYVRFNAGRKIDIKAKTGLIINPQYWSNESHQVRQRAEFRDKDLIKQKLNGLSGFIIEAYNTDQETQKDLKWLNSIIENFHAGRTDKKGQIDLFSFIEDFIKKSETRLNPKTGEPIDRKQRSEYSKTFKYLQEFSVRKGRPLNFRDIDLDFYHDFVIYLQNQGLAANTIGRKIQTIKIFMNAALEEGKTSYQGHKSKRFRAPKEDPETVALTEGELKALQDLDLSKDPRLDRVRDLFLIGCWTGQRFSDWPKINLQDINNGMLTIRQEKTRGRVVIPVHPVVKGILDKYDGTLPEISNQKFNEYLKELCQLDELKDAGFRDPVQKTQTRGGITRTVKYEKWQLLGSHTGRRTFATIHYRAGFPTLSLMKITGHSTESSFLRYIRVTDEEHAEKLREFWQKNSGHLKVVK